MAKSKVYVFAEAEAEAGNPPSTMINTVYAAWYSVMKK